MIIKILIMSLLAFELIQQCIETKNPELDLGLCDLTDTDFKEGSLLDKELRKCIHLQTLIIGTSWYDYRNKCQRFSRNKGGNNLLSVHPPAILELNELTCLIFSTAKENIKGIINMSFVARLKKLVHLDLSNNRIEDIEGLGQLKDLQILDLNSNRIDLIKGLDGLAGLQHLNISNNRYIRKIRELQHLKALQTLNLSDNYIEEIQGVDGLQALQSMDIRLNSIRDIVPLLPFLNRLVNPLRIVVKYNETAEHGEINVAGNGINTPPFDTVIQGNEAILAYFENLKISKIIPFREAKVILLGEPDAGKTSLLNYFMGKPFTEEKSVTRGVNIEKCKFRHKGNEYQINFWDFGGQEVQQSVHQYFLTDNTLYLIVLNAVTDEQPDKYLQFLDNHAPNSPFIIVTNKDDLNGTSKLNNNALSFSYRGRLVSSEYRISVRQATRKEYCYNSNSLYLQRKKELLSLFEQVKKSFLQLPHIEQAFLLNYKAVKEVVETIYEKDKRPYITMQEFQQYCNGAGIALGTEKGLLRHLNFIGTVRYIDKDNLRGLHILNPEWLSDGIYRIITDGGVKNRKQGKIEKKDIIHILRTAQESEYTYQDNEIDFIITMMCHFRVAYFDDQSKFIYIPGLFPEDLPHGFDKQNFIKEAKHYFFSYEIEIPSYIISRFIVKMFSYVKKNIYWNKGIVLQFEDHKLIQCDALVEQNDRKIDIWIKGRYIQLFFVILREAIRNSHEENFKKFEEVIDLKEETVNYHEILNLKLDGDHSFKSKRVTDDRTGKLKHYNINEVLGIFESPGETRKYERNIIINSGRDTNIAGVLAHKYNRVVNKEQEPEKRKAPANNAYKARLLKNYRLYGWIFLLVSLFITLGIVWVMMQERVGFIPDNSWQKFRKSEWVKFGGVVLGLLWNGVIMKLWYERTFDKSKQKAYLDSL